ncbi:DUF4105 domain-containing protein [Desulfurobacterium atlanticum]|uniref:Uncharacterized protein n=1 Tax=Desulfurobacterium atlanticum TaxID=240169 RepID=A0A238ZZC5_9BACT|nr:DUF4105 domain-containing protein [Desulfurobacterium atlanticum]SNR88208.1 protein of unknown function [Desulfurobacterium atlanticum]
MRAICLFILFLFLFPAVSFAENTLLSVALEKKIYKKPEWKALLHYNGHGSFINDTDFILSSDKFSLKRELEKTVNLILSTANSTNPAVCSFPARWLFILKETGMDVDAGINRCTGLNNFIQLLEGEKLYLGYVSKDVTDVTKMMGHLFIEFEGKEDYAVSFLALIDSSSPLKLGWDSLFTGIDAGFFLEPFNTQLDEYLWVDGRGVWRYRLKLSDYRQKLLLYHIYELKSAKLKYNYVFYNCATVVYYLLSVANPSLLKEKPLIVTPLKVVRLAEKERLLSDEEFFQDVKSVMGTLQREVGLKTVLKIKDGNYQNLDARGRFLAEIYRCYRLKEKDINDEVCETVFKKFLTKSSLLNAPFENHISAGFIEDFDGEKFLHLKFFPVLNDILDDNRYNFKEESVKFGEMEIGVSTKKLRFYKLGLYEINAFREFTYLVPQITKRFFIGFKRYPDGSSGFFAFSVSGGAGLSLKPMENATVYFLLNQDAGFYEDGFFALFYPSAGAIYYPFSYGKTLFSLNRYFSFRKSLNFPEVEFSINQVFFLNRHLNVDFEFNRLYGKECANRFKVAAVFLF